MASGDKEDGPQKSPKKTSELSTIMGTTYQKEKFELEKSAIMKHPNCAGLVSGIGYFSTFTSWIEPLWAASTLYWELSILLPRPISVIRKTKFFSPRQWNVVPDQELETLDHF